MVKESLENVNSQIPNTFWGKKKGRAGDHVHTLKSEMWISLQSSKDWTTSLHESGQDRRVWVCGGRKKWVSTPTRRFWRTWWVAFGAFWSGNTNPFQLKWASVCDLFFGSIPQISLVAITTSGISSYFHTLFLPPKSY